MVTLGIQSADPSAVRVRPNQGTVSVSISIVMIIASLAVIVQMRNAHSPGDIL